VSGTWKKAPGVRWNPARVRANGSGELPGEWLDDAVVFIQTEKQLQKWFGEKRNRLRKSTGCLVLPRSLAEHPDAPTDRAILLADDHGRAVRALAMHARARMGGKVVLLAGSVETSSIRRSLSDLLAKSGELFEPGRGRRLPPQILHFMASASESARYAVFECTSSGTADEYNQLSEALRPDVVVVGEFDQAHFVRLLRTSKTRQEALTKLVEQQAQLARHLRPGGAVVLNSDMRHFRDLRPYMAADHRVLTYGAGGEADVQLISTAEDSGEAVIRIRDSAETHRFGSPPESAGSAAAAAAVLLAFGNIEAAAQAGATSRRPAPGGESAVGVSGG
jgi:UDP-N-acetylmuramyl pentapeptide synthase